MSVCLFLLKFLYFLDNSIVLPYKILKSFKALRSIFVFIIYKLEGINKYDMAEGKCQLRFFHSQLNNGKILKNWH